MSSLEYINFEIIFLLKNDLNFLNGISVFDHIFILLLYFSNVSG